VEAQEELDKLSPAIEFQDKIYHRLVKIAGGEESLDALEDACETLANEDDSLNAFDLKRRLWAAGLVNLGAYPWADKAAGRELFALIEEYITDVIVFDHPWFAKICAIFVLQSYFFKDLYPRVFYIAFTSGKHGAAKTTATQTTINVCKGGMMAAGLTVASLERLDVSEYTLGIDELDAFRPDVRYEIERTLRTGYKRGGFVLKVEDETSAKGKKANRESIKFYTFGPKIFTFRGSIDEALLSRSIVIPLTPVGKEDRVDVVGDVLARDVEEMEGEMLREKLKSFSDKVLETWDMARVHALMKDTDFRAKVSIAEEVGAGPRNTEFSYLALLTCEIAGVDMIDEIREAVTGQTDYVMEDYVEEFRAVVQEVYLSMGRPGRMINRDLRREINKVREQDKDKPLSFKGIKGLLRKLEFRDGIELRRGSGGPPSTYFTSHAVKCLNPDPTQQPALKLPTSLFDYTDENLTAQESVGRESLVQGMEERMQLLESICVAKIEENEEMGKPVFTLEDVHAHPDVVRLPDGFVEKMMKRWQLEGKIWENPKDVWHMAY
jgi:hypothetical protein